jgi:hypothetical protein
MIKKYVDGPDVITRRKFAFSTENFDVFHFHLEKDGFESYLGAWRAETSETGASYNGFCMVNIKKVEREDSQYVVMGYHFPRLPQFKEPARALSFVAELICGIQEFAGPLSFNYEDILETAGMSHDELMDYMSELRYRDA